MDFRARTNAIQRLERRSPHRKQGRCTISENTLRSPTWQQTQERPQLVRAKKRQMTGKGKRNCDPDLELR